MAQAAAERITVRLVLLEVLIQERQVAMVLVVAVLVLVQLVRQRRLERLVRLAVAAGAGVVQAQRQSAWLAPVMMVDRSVIHPTGCRPRTARVPEPVVAEPLALFLMATSP